jgi:hypothetical protein
MLREQPGRRVQNRRHPAPAACLPPGRARLSGDPTFKR